MTRDEKRFLRRELIKDYIHLTHDGMIIRSMYLIKYYVRMDEKQYYNQVLNVYEKG